MTTRTVRPWIVTERLLARLFMIVTAVVLLVTGYSLLTSPLWIPITVGLWLGAAAIAAVTVWGPLPLD
jgi:hypothetical protein